MEYTRGRHVSETAAVAVTPVGEVAEVAEARAKGLANGCGTVVAQSGKAETKAGRGQGGNLSSLSGVLLLDLLLRRLM